MLVGLGSSPQLNLPTAVTRGVPSHTHPFLQLPWDTWSAGKLSCSPRTLDPTSAGDLSTSPRGHVLTTLEDLWLTPSEWPLLVPKPHGHLPRPYFDHCSLQDKHSPKGLLSLVLSWLTQAIFSELHFRTHKKKIIPIEKIIPYLIFY